MYGQNLIEWKDTKVSLDTPTKALFVNHKLMAYIEKMDNLWSLWGKDGHIIDKYDTLEAAKNDAEDQFVPKPVVTPQKEDAGASGSVYTPGIGMLDNNRTPAEDIHKTVCQVYPELCKDESGKDTAANDSPEEFDRKVCEIFPKVDGCEKKSPTPPDVCGVIPELCNKEADGSTCKVYAVLPDIEHIYCGDKELTDEQLKLLPDGIDIKIYREGDPDIPKHQKREHFDKPDPDIAPRVLHAGNIVL